MKKLICIKLIFVTFSLLIGNDLQSLYDSQNYPEIVAKLNENNNNYLKDKDLSYLAYLTYKDLNLFNEAAVYLDAVRKIENNDDLTNQADELKNIISAYNSCKNDYDKATTISDLNQILENINQYNSKYSDLSKLLLIEGKVFQKFHIFSKNSDNPDYLDKHQNNYYLTKAVSSFRKSFELNRYEYLPETKSLILLDFSNDIRNIAKQLVKDGKDQLKTGDYSNSKKSFELAINFDEKYGVSYMYLGEFLKKNSDFESAIKNYKIGLKYSGFNIPVQHSIGYCYEKINEKDNAIKAYKTVLDNDPFYTKSKFALANIYYSTQDAENLKLSEELLRDITIDEPDFENAYYVLASIYFDRNDMSSSKDICDEGLEYLPKSYKLHYKKALACNELSLYDEGRIHAEKALKINKKYYPAIYELGISWMNLCNKYEAEKAFKKAARDRKFKKESNKYLDGALNNHIKQNCSN